MSEQIKKTIALFSDEYLLEQYLFHAENYLPEAIEIMKAEIEKRNISKEKLEEFKSRRHSKMFNDTKNFSVDDFTAMSRKILLGDIFAFQAILNENKIPFIVVRDETTISSMIPIDADSGPKSFTVSVPKDMLQKAEAIIAEHFDSSSEFYTVKYTNILDKLRSINFFELQLTEDELEQQVSIVLTKEEKQGIIELANILHQQAEQLEQNGKVLFFYDGLDKMIQAISEETPKLAKNDLLVILELFQIYCDHPLLSSTLKETASCILEFLTKHN